MKDKIEGKKYEFIVVKRDVGGSSLIGPLVSSLENPEPLFSKDAKYGQQAWIITRKAPDPIRGIQITFYSGFGWRQSDPRDTP